MAEKYDVLAQKSAPLSSALGTDMPVIPTRKDGSPDYLSAYETFKKPKLAKTENLYKEQGEFEALQREEGARQEGKLAAGKAENIRKQKKDIEESQTSKDLTTLEDQYMHAAFVPTQATMGEMAALFSLIGVTGMLIGAGSKGNSQAAMSAMSGMMKGYREGNEDLYKKEKATFDENLKVMSQRKEMLTRRLEQIAKLATMDKDAADEELTVLLAGEKADFYKAYKDKFGLPKLIELDKEVNKADETKFNFIVKEDERVREEARRRAEKLEDEQRRKEDKIEAEKRALRDREEFARYAAGLKGGGGAAVSGMSPKELFEDAAKAIANYAEKPPALRDPQRNALLARARQINPTYNEGDFGNQNAAYRNWIIPNSSGSKQIGAFTTVAGHLNTLEKLGDALNNKDTPAINSALNWFQTQAGYPQVTNFNAAKQAVAAEIVKAIEGTAGALRDRQDAQEIFSAIQSPAQLKGNIDIVKELINSRLETSRVLFEAGTGRKNFDELLPPVVRQTFQAGRGGYQSAAPALTGAAAIPTGATKPSSQAVAPALTGAETGRDEKGSFHYEYNEDKTKRRKVYD